MQTGTMSNAPEWIKNLHSGDTIVVCFPYTGNTIIAEVINNSPDSFSSHTNTFGSLTVKYTWKNVERNEDLLYSDYSQNVEFQNNWYAFCLI